LSPIIDHIDTRLASIKAMPVDVIAALPPLTESSVTLHGKAYSIALWNDRLEDGSIRVVVQGYRALVLGIGHMSARGFVVSSKGEVRDLADEELWEFT
jgi:hypothetical protein